MKYIFVTIVSFQMQRSVFGNGPLKHFFFQKYRLKMPQLKKKKKLISI